jgi:hypothetical protein
MIPNFYPLPVEEMIWLKRDELLSEFGLIRLQREARLSNPGLIERAYIRLGNLLVKAGKRLQDEYTSSRPAYRIASGKFTA